MSWNGTSVWSCSGMDNVTIPNWKTPSIGNMTQKHHGDFAASVHFYKSRGGVWELSSHSKSMGVMCLAFRWHTASFSMLWKHVVNHWWWWSIEFKVHWVLWSLGVGHVWTAFCLLSAADFLNKKSHGDHGNCLSAVFVSLFCQIFSLSPSMWTFYLFEEIKFDFY